MIASGIDLDAAEAAFAASVDGTVGLEEEFAILDPSTLALAPRFDELRETAADDPVLGPAIAGELIRGEIEIVSGRGEDAGDAIVRQREARRRLFALTAERGALLAACGTHPWTTPADASFIDTDHYRRVVDGLRYVARRNCTFSLHVHVGVRGADRAVAACDRLRGVLPALLALSASSPWLDGLDAGLHSARTQAFTKSFPRCGVPDAFGSWAAYRDYVAWLERSGAIVEATQLWWSVRPHLRLGTVEVRICDAQPTAGESEGLARLIAGCVAAAVRDEDDGRPRVDPPARVVEENVWRAVRHGMDGELLDLVGWSGEGFPDPVPAREAVARLATWAGVDLRWAPELNPAQRLRALLADGASLREAYAEAVAWTQATYPGGP